MKKQNSVRKFVFDLLVNGCSIQMIVDELNKKGTWGKNWKAVDLKKLVQSPQVRF